jgi:flagellar biosynthesis/type III secretory pathway chaperone
VIASATPSPHALLQLEIAGYKALLRLLDGECDALRRIDVEAIESTSAAKQAQVQSLEQLARLRRDDLAARGLPGTTAGVQIWLAGEDDAAAAAASWATLLDLARAARQANLRNGRLMVRQRRHYDGALAALLQAAGVPTVYGADGRPQAGPAPRALVTI